MSWQEEASMLQLDSDVLGQLGRLTAIQQGISSLGDFGLEAGRETHAPYANAQKDLSRTQAYSP